MDTIGARLALAMQQKGQSVRDFQRAMESRKGGKILGTSYANIRRYLLTGAEPSPSFLRAAAEELGVRVEWLSFNSGSRQDPQPAGDRDVFDEEMGRAFPPYLLSRPVVQDDLASVWYDVTQRRAETTAGRRMTEAEVSEAAQGDVGREVAERMGKSITHLMDAVDGNPIDLNNPLTRDAYLLAITQALTIASGTFIVGVARMLSDPALKRAGEEDGEVDPETEVDE